MTRIIVTDLTRFLNGDIVCTAGVTADGTTIRPMPYLKTKWCREFNLSPGAILEGRFRSKREPPPHIEDASYRNLSYCGRCRRDAFHQVLERTAFASLRDGFETDVEANQKCIPVETPPARSLFTLKIPPCQLEIVRDRFHEEKLKVHFTDNCGLQMSHAGLTDREFHEYAQCTTIDVAKINRFVRSQDELYLRIGLSRTYRAEDGRHGYWMQVNGLHTFPDSLPQFLSSTAGPIDRDSTVREKTWRERVAAGIIGL